MIQFNLLPDVKLEYIKTERTKRLVITVAILASAAALAIFVILFLTVNVLQKKNLSDLNGDIQVKTASIKKIPDLDKVLTIQNQLSALNGLHDKKPVASRLYDYMGQVIPSNVTVSNTTVDFGLSTITFTGNSQSLDAVNTFVDTLKFTTYKTTQNNVEAKPFNSVVLSTFSRTPVTASYSITLAFEPTIFDVTQNVTLTVPKTVTTRSVTEQPLFKKVEE